MSKNVLDQHSVALVIIDMQEDFAHPSGAAYINGTAEIISSIAGIAALFRKHGRPVYHVIRLYHPDGSNAELCRREMISSGHSVVAPGTSGAAILQDLLPDHCSSVDHEELLKGEVTQMGDHDYVLYKPRWGAFFNTRLHEELRLKGITGLLIVGCNFPNCPRTTFYEASERDYHLAMAPFAISGVYDRGVTELENIGAHRFNDLAEITAFVEKAVILTGFRPQYKSYFESLNKAWLNKYFSIEPIDEYVLAHPEEAIINEGGEVLFALKDGKVMGTVALKNIEPGVMELTKMGVEESQQGAGLGKMLCAKAIETARQKRKSKVVLYSSSKLTRALTMYRNMGFVDVPVNTDKYKRADVMMTLSL